jgi:hypothetical protein
MLLVWLALLLARSCMRAAYFLQSKIHNARSTCCVGGMTGISFKLSKQLLHCAHNRGGIFKLLMSPGIDSKESIPPADVAWRARYDNPIPTRFHSPQRLF